MINAALIGGGVKRATDARILAELSNKIILLIESK